MVHDGRVIQRMAGWRLAVALGLAAGLGCSHQPVQQNPALLTHHMWEWLPGHYDDAVQRSEDRRAGHAPPPAVRLTIVSVSAPFLGEHVFYAQESTADLPPRILRQRLLTYRVVKEEILESSWSFTDPPRWRAGDVTPELFTALQPPDLTLERGCERVWKYDKDAERFTATGARERCRTNVPGVGEAYAERRAELSADELALSDQAFDADGKRVSGRADEALVRFRRRPAD